MLVVVGNLNAKAAAGPRGGECVDFAEVSCCFILPAQKFGVSKAAETLTITKRRRGSLGGHRNQIGKSRADGEGW